MLLRYDAERLEQMLRDFHNLTGICICILNAEREKLVAYPSPTNPFCCLIQTEAEGKRRCFCSDRDLLTLCEERRVPVTHRCHAGLVDTVVPIIQNDVLLGFLLFGQVCHAEDEPVPFEEIYQNISDLGLSRAALEEAYGSLMFFDEKKIESAASLVEMLTKHIWLEQLMDPVFPEGFEKILAYIDAHLAEELTVPALCRQFHLSKNTLYGHFKTYTGYTVKDYVNQRRLAQAEHLLASTDLPIYEICERAGLDNPHYFCRLFKQKRGLSPLRYRKAKQTEEYASAVKIK